MDIIGKITRLSHEFGVADYVRGGGGNTSCKNDVTLWVKPSGTTLLGMKPDTFVAMDRAAIGKLFKAERPGDASAREAMVKDLMAAAVLPDCTGRPSVEAPLHESFDATFVVHTHPALVNGMTCSKNGKAACAELFPEALWIDYTDPGYTLCMKVRDDMEKYAADKGKQPDMVFLENHGVFIAGNTDEEIRAIYAGVMDTLSSVYREKNVCMAIEIEPAPAAEKIGEIEDKLRATVGEDDAAFVSVSGVFPVATGPISPDHIVYSKSYPLMGEVSSDAVAAFKAKNGYAPRVVATGEAVCGLGTTSKNADLALEFAQDGALVMQLAEAFGGIQYMTDAARDFIDNWEVESYRRKVAEQ